MRKLIKIRLIAMAAVGLFTVGIAGWSWAQQPPKEVRTLENVLKRLSRGNNIGNQPIAFMVVSGNYAAHLAQQRGLCKPDECDMFTQLNPYKRYNNGWDELIRQDYAVGDIAAWTASTGTIVISRASFRAYGSRNDYLACTVAHELAHLKRNHIFKASYFTNHNLKGYSKEQKKLEEMKFSRKQELEADRDAATMLSRSGYVGRVCQQELVFMYSSIGNGSITEPESTHPGYEDRIKSIRNHYDALKKQQTKPQKNTRARYNYDNHDNLLTLTPLT